MSSLPLERAQVLFREGRIRAALSVFGDNVPENPALALSRAAALSELGRPQEALAAARAVEIAHRAHATTLASAQTVIGAIQLDWGSSAEGVSTLTSAYALAESAGAHAEAARAAMRIFSSVHSASGKAESADYLRRAAFSVLKASQPRLLAELYCRVGQADAQDGQLQTARHHLELAVDILQEHPEFLLLARTKLTLSSTLALSFRNDLAAKQAREALEAAEVAGSVGMTRRCRSNVAQLQYRTGLVESAHRNAKELLQATDLAPRFRLAILETYVAAQLELGACSPPDQEVVEFLSAMEQQEDPTWTSVEAIPTQARVLDLISDLPAERHYRLIQPTGLSILCHLPGLER